MQHIQQYLTDLKIALDALDPAQIEAVRDRVAAVRERGGQLFLCGNGGSAATASTWATTWVRVPATVARGRGSG